MMTPQEYILERLSGLKVSAASIKFSSQGDLVDFIYRAVMSKKFRKYSVNSEYQKHIHSAIELNVREGQPIKLTLIFGGYKLWRFEEAPEPDWAELFSIMYYAYWMKPIADNYEPGVWFDFYSDDVIVEIIDNVPKQDTEQYCAIFSRVLDFVRPYLPPNLKMTLNRVGQQYHSLEEFRKDLDEQIVQLRSKSMNQLEPLSAGDAAVVELNVRPTPDQQKDAAWREKVKLVHDAYMLVSKRRPYYRTPDKIVAITRAAQNSIAVGTTKTSVAKFWVGVGALQSLVDGYIEVVLSPGQAERAVFQWQSMSIPGIVGKNFNNIRITK